MRGDLPEHEIPYFVSVRVIELLEMVDIDQDSADWPTIALCTMKFPRNPLIDEAPIAQTRKGVRNGLFSQSLRLTQIGYCKGDVTGQRSPSATALPQHSRR